MPETHYVVIVHGTWSASTGEAPTWWQASDAADSFCGKLNEALSDGPMGRAVWRNLSPKVREFQWSGANTHAARVEAGNSLALYIQEILDRDSSARVHLIAHSHGGNVVLKAMDHYLRRLHEESWNVARLAMSALTSGSQATAFDAIEWAVQTTRSTSFWNQFRSVMDAHPEVAMSLETQRRKHKDGFEGDSLTTYKVTEERSYFANLRRPECKPDSRVAWAAFYVPFMQLWQRHASSMEIGRLVFLGTPFFEKKWTSNRSRSSRLKNFFIRLAFGSVMTAAVAAIGLSLFFGFKAVRDGITSREWLLSSGLLVSWLVMKHGRGVAKLFGAVPLAIVGAITLTRVVEHATLGNWVIVLIVCLLLVVVQLMWHRDRTDVNPYFSEEFPLLSARKGTRPIFDALVVHASAIDEVFLGFGAEPVLAAALFPQIEWLVSPRPLFRFEAERIGESDGLDVLGRRLARRLSRTLQGLIYWPFWFLLGRAIVKRTQDAMMGLLLSIAHGFSPEEYRDGRIQFSRTVGMDNFFSESSWDVSTILAVSPSGSREDANDSSNGWSFLWDEQERARRLEKSDLWRRLAFRAASTGDAQLDSVQQKALQQSVLSMEQRFRELKHEVDLRHSRYYSNETVIRGVSSFLNHGHV